MNTDKHRFFGTNLNVICVYLCSSAVPLLLLGCAGSPSQANIELRKELQQSQQRIESLERQQQADAATIKSFESQRGTIPTLTKDRLDKLFTTAGLSFGRLTGGADLDSSRPGDEGVKVYVVPTDQTGDELKAAGSFVVELFDLNKPADNRIGRWEFNAEQTKQSWFGSALLYTYILTCPFQQPPTSKDLTLQVTFRDELTGREFTHQKPIEIAIP